MDKGDSAEKAKSQTFQQLNLKTAGAILLLVIISFVIGYIIVFKSFFRQSSSVKQEPQDVTAVQSPTPTIDQTNPFNIKTNPFRGVKTNPFK